jgi:hypothetical protein
MAAGIGLPAVHRCGLGHRLALHLNEPFNNRSHMKPNMGTADRIIRVVLALLFALLYFTGTVTGTFGVVLLVLGVVFVLTSVVSFCPLYALVGLNTCGAGKG